MSQSLARFSTFIHEESLWPQILQALFHRVLY